MKLEKQLVDYNKLYDSLEPWLDRKVPIMLFDPPTLVYLHSFGKLDFTYSKVFLNRKELKLRFVTYSGVPDVEIAPMNVICALNSNAEQDINITLLWKEANKLTETMNVIEKEVFALRGELEISLPYGTLFTHENFSYIKLHPLHAYGSVSMGPITVFTDFEEVLKLCF